MYVVTHFVLFLNYKTFDFVCVYVIVLLVSILFKYCSLFQCGAQISKMSVVERDSDKKTQTSDHISERSMRLSVFRSFGNRNKMATKYRYKYYADGIAIYYIVSLLLKCAILRMCIFAFDVFITHSVLLVFF